MLERINMSFSFVVFLLLFVLVITGDLTTVSLGIGGDEDFRSITVVGENEYIVVGETSFYPEFEGNIFLAKFDNDLNLVWTKVLGGDSFDNSYLVRPTRDGGFVVVGTSGSDNFVFPGSYITAAYLLKFDSNGTLEWGRSIQYPNKIIDHPVVVETSDGSFIYSMMVVSIKSLVLFRISKDGDEEATSCVGFAHFLDPLSMIETSDHKFVVVGNIYSNALGLVAKFHNNLTLDWSRQLYRDGEGNTVYSIVETNDGYVVTGKIEYLYLILSKISKDGNLLWSRTIKGEIFYDLGGPRCSGTDILKQDDGFVIAGYMTDFPIGPGISSSRKAMILVKYDTSGNLLWMKRNNFASDMVEPLSFGIVRDNVTGGYVLAGRADTFNSLYSQDLNPRRFDPGEYQVGIISKVSVDGEGCLWENVDNVFDYYNGSVSDIKLEDYAEMETTLNQSLFSFRELDTEYGVIYVNVSETVEPGCKTLCKKPCPLGYFGDYCEITTCGGIFNNDSESTFCSGRGTCEFLDDCECDDDYYGVNCEVSKCLGIIGNSSTVCGGHGICSSHENCKCHSGYTSSDYETSPCDIWYCFGRIKLSDDVCSGRGECVGHDHCICSSDFEGNACDTWSCGYDYKLVDQTCSGNGKCKWPDHCDCDTGYVGEYCGTNILLSTVMAPILVIFGSIILSISSVMFCCIIIFTCCCSCCLICMFCVSVIFLSFFTCCLSGITLFLRLRVKYFSRLKNFDIHLKEQEIEDNDSIAHVKINKSLFEINFEEIKIERILGEGGSNSVVYSAKWSGNKVAFKCFKTRTFCSKQDSFNEFEKEVQIMSSINHPNIVQFLGATLSPPRVGILMEFCSNGEINKFFKKFSKKNGNQKYPLSEKIRMMLEIASSLDYLHARDIIHRDLKSENVLLDSQERSQLMDFGLSRLVERMSMTKTTRIGTAVYMAPEIISDVRYTEKCDVFSFAILMYVMITEQDNPYLTPGKNERSFGIEIKVSNDPDFRPDIAVFEKEFENHFLDFEYYESNDFWEEMKVWLVGIVRTCWRHDYSDRLSMNNLCDQFTEKLEDIDSGAGERISKNIQNKVLESNEIIKFEPKDEEEEEEEGDERLRNKIDDLEIRIIELKQGNVHLKKEAMKKDQRIRVLEKQLEDIKGF